jgi:hypothetical protein
MSGYGNNSSLEWVASTALRDTSGHVLSWLSQGHAGYPYPEVSGYLLALLADTGRHSERRASLVQALLAQPEAGVERNGVLYAFDTGMALNGLGLEMRSGNVTPRLTDRAAAWALRVQEFIGRRRARVPPVPLRDETHWSDAFGSHESKLALPLVNYVTLFGPDEDARAALDRLLRLVLALQEPDGRFRVHAQSPLTYVHSHCYALEGLLAQSLRPLTIGQQSSVTDALSNGADWLAEIQSARGGLHAWHDGEQASGPLRSDATAQAARIWQLVSAEGYRRPLARAMEFMQRSQSSLGALPYQPSTKDLNSWATIFWAQVQHWRETGADPKWLV